MTESNKMTALLTQWPTFREWVVANLTSAHLETVMKSAIESRWFGDDHPLSNRRLTAEIFQAYRQELAKTFDCILKRLVEVENLGIVRDTTLEDLPHIAVISDARILLLFHPEIRAEARLRALVAAERSEIQRATLLAVDAVAPVGAVDKRRRL